MVSNGIFDCVFSTGFSRLFYVSDPVASVEHFNYALSREWPCLSEHYAFPSPQIVSQEYA